MCDCVILCVIWNSVLNGDAPKTWVEIHLFTLQYLEVSSQCPEESVADHTSHILTAYQMYISRELYSGVCYCLPYRIHEEVP
jgi:hypothetical protein